MKSKMFRLALQLIVLAGFLLTQGCATGQCPVDWLNWPYNTPNDEAFILPTDDYTMDSIDSTDSILLPPDIYTSESYVAPVVSDVPGQVYVVQKGDTLSAIASMYGTSWKKLAEYNNLANPNKLVVGQEILIQGTLSATSAPVSRPASQTTSVRTSSAPIAQGTSYVIQKGDTLSGIAKRAGLTVNEVKAANALASNRIIAGKSLSIPKKGDVSVTVLSEPAPEPVTINVETMAAPELAPIAELAPLVPASSAPVYEHVLYPGESLEDVARQFGSSQEEIMLLNGITDPTLVKPGTKLLIPISE